jgi:hypothetical protein
MFQRLSAVILASAALFACGGSSSETPPPLEPHPRNLHYSRAATTLGNDVELLAPDSDDAGASQAREPSDDEPDDFAPAAPRTWGGEPAAPAPK